MPKKSYEIMVERTVIQCMTVIVNEAESDEDAIARAKAGIAAGTYYSDWDDVDNTDSDYDYNYKIDSEEEIEEDEDEE